MSAEACGEWIANVELDNKPLSNFSSPRLQYPACTIHCIWLTIEGSLGFIKRKENLLWTVFCTMPTSALKVPPQTRSSQALSGGIRSAERIQPIKSQSCMQVFCVTWVPPPTMVPTGLLVLPDIVNDLERLFSFPNKHTKESNFFLFHPPLIDSPKSGQALYWMPQKFLSVRMQIL